MTTPHGNTPREDLMEGEDQQMSMNAVNPYMQMNNSGYRPMGYTPMNMHAQHYAASMQQQQYIVQQQGQPQPQPQPQPQQGQQIPGQPPVSGQQAHLAPGSVPQPTPTQSQFPNGTRGGYTQNGYTTQPPPIPVQQSQAPTPQSQTPTPTASTKDPKTRVPQRPVMTRGIMPNGYANGIQMMNYRRQMSNVEVLKFLDFCELIGVRSESTKNILYWKKIITEYFSEIGVLRYSVKSGVDQRQFEFSVPIIPRFFFSIIQSGVSRIEIQPGMLRTQLLANGTTYIESLRCCFTHHYSDGSYVNIYGTMKGVFNQSLKFEWLDFQTHVFIPGVEWPSLEKLLSDDTKMKDIVSLVNEKRDDPKEPNSQLLQTFRSNYQVFHSMSNFGLQESVMRVMQVSDVMAHLKSLMLFAISSNSSGPLNALDEFVSKSQLKKDDKKKDTKDSPGESPLNRNKATQLDMSQSTLTKRRRKSTIGELSPKSLESPKSKSMKKSKR